MDQVQYDMIKEAAYQDELEKIAISEGAVRRALANRALGFVVKHEDAFAKSVPKGKDIIPQALADMMTPKMQKGFSSTKSVVGKQRKEAKNAIAMIQGWMPKKGRGILEAQSIRFPVTRT